MTGAFRLDSIGGLLMKSKIMKVFGVTVVSVCFMVFAFACTQSTDNESIEERTNETIKEARAQIDEAKEKGVEIEGSEVALLEKAESETKEDPLQALVDASMVRAYIEKEVREAFDIAKSVFETAKNAAEVIINNAPEGSDMSQAKQSLSNADSRAADAKTLSDWYNPSEGPIFWANLAGQQAAAAAYEHATSTGLQRGIEQEQNQIAIHFNHMLTEIDKYLVAKNYAPSTFTIGITKVSPDASIVTAAAVPQQPLPDQPLYFTFIFQFKNGSYSMVSSQ